MNEEKVLTLRGKRAVWAPGGGSGPIDPSRLPEGYPYKEGSKTEIVWDGNTEGKLVVGDVFFKVSDAVLDDETIKNGVLSAALRNNPTEKVISELWDSLVSKGLVTENGVMVNEYCIFAKADNVSIGGMDIPEAGIYFPLMEGNLYTYEFISETEAIHPMSAEFLPALTSPNGTKYQLTVADDGTLSAVQV